MRGHIHLFIIRMARTKGAKEGINEVKLLQFLKQRELVNTQSNSSKVKDNSK